MKIFKLIVSLIASSLLFVACATTSTPTVTSTTNAVGVVTSVTNSVTTVNAANLAIDCAVLQTSFSIGVSVAVQKDPSIVPILQDTSVALSGILNGASTNSATQVLAILGKNNNATIAANITPIINSLSSFEQTLIKKYGASVGGQITLAVANAVNIGIQAGLPVAK